jgi:hypothetical protein
MIRIIRDQLKGKLEEFVIEESTKDELLNPLDESQDEEYPQELINQPKVEIILNTIEEVEQPQYETLSDIKLEPEEVQDMTNVLEDMLDNSDDSIEKLARYYREIGEKKKLSFLLISMFY